MELITLGSSSRGNCYLLRASDGETLVLEAGIGFAAVKQALRHDISRISAVAVSHRHGDHAAHIPDFPKNGIWTMALEDTLRHAGISGRPFTRAIQPLKGYTAGSFRLLTIPLVHDVPSIGFIIDHPEMGRTAFITDTMMLEYRLPDDITHYMLECNYSDAILQENLMRGITSHARAARTRASHMELRTAKGILRANCLSRTRNIILIHLSPDNADPALFRSEIERTAGIPVHIAAKGAVIDISKEPY